MAHLETVPSLRELAERLAVVQRWNGRTTAPWSVLQHTILTAGLIPDDATPYLRIAVLMHDVAEAYTGDIPWGFKCPEQSKFEMEILAEIHEGLKIPYKYGHKDLKYFDMLAALVEAQCLIRPSQRREVVANHASKYPLNAPQVERGEDLVWNLLDLPSVEAVNWWTKATQDVVDQLTIPEEERAE